MNFEDRDDDCIKERQLFFCLNVLTKKNGIESTHTEAVPIELFFHSNYPDGSATAEERRNYDFSNNTNPHCAFTNICNFPEATIGFREGDVFKIFRNKPFWTTVTNAFKEDDFCSKYLSMDASKYLLCPKTKNNANRCIIPYPILPYILAKLPRELALLNNINVICMNLLQQLISYEEDLQTNIDIFKDYREQFVSNYIDVLKRKDITIHQLAANCKVLSGYNEYLRGEITVLRNQNAEFEKRLEKIEGSLFKNNKRKRSLEQNNNASQSNEEESCVDDSQDVSFD
jgi:hypothetical protein